MEECCPAAKTECTTSPLKYTQGINFTMYIACSLVWLDSNPYVMINILQSSGIKITNAWHFISNFHSVVPQCDELQESPLYSSYMSCVS